MADTLLGPVIRRSRKFLEKYREPDNPTIHPNLALSPSLIERANRKAELGDHHFLHMFYPPSPMAAKQKAKSAVKYQQEVMLNQCSSSACKHVSDIYFGSSTLPASGFGNDGRGISKLSFSSVSPGPHHSSILATDHSAPQVGLVNLSRIFKQFKNKILIQSIDSVRILAKCSVIK